MISLSIERFHNSCALANFLQGGIFLRKMPLGSSGFGVQQLWNRCTATIELCPQPTSQRKDLSILDDES
jgi:hypothetical protein